MTVDDAKPRFLRAHRANVSKKAFAESDRRMRFPARPASGLSSRWIGMLIGGRAPAPIGGEAIHPLALIDVLAVGVISLNRSPTTHPQPRA